MSLSDEHAIVTTTETLIQRLYSGSAAPGEVVQIQDRLQKLQKGESAWLLAQKLLSHPDQNARFFAALTFVIKINQDVASLPEDAVSQLLTTLVAAFVARVDANEGQVVLRKICSALAALLVQSSSGWPSPIVHIVKCLYSHQAMSPQSVESQSASFDDISTLTPYALSALLSFTTILAEDVGRVPNTSRYVYCHEILSKNVEDAVTIMKFVFQQESEGNTDQQSDVLQCYQAWISYARDRFSVGSEQMECLHQILSPLMAFLRSKDTFEATAEFFIDIFSDDQSFLKQQDFSSFIALLYSDWCPQELLKLESDDADDESLLFGQLVLAFGSAAVDLLIKSHDEHSLIMEIIHRVTRIQNYKNINQALANQICDFWDDYTTGAPDVESETPEERVLFAAAKDQWLQAIDELTAGAALSPEQLSGVKPTITEDSLSEFRSRVRSTIQTSYDEFGVSVLRKLIDLSLREGNTDQANSPATGQAYSQGQLEVILYCLGDLSTSMEYHAGEEDTQSLLLERFFTSPMFTTLVQSQGNVPVLLRKRAINIMADQDEYFRNHGQHLLAALDMLFSSIQQPKLSESAARAIRYLSDSGRELLVSRVTDFCNAAEIALSTPSLGLSAKEDVLAAASFVVEATSKDNKNLAPLINRLFTIVLNNVKLNINQKSQASSTNKAIKESYLEALNQLHMLAKSVQRPGIHVISLDDDAAENTTSKSPIDELNGRIITAIAAFLVPREDGQLLEAACRILRAGYKETPPAYFNFEPSFTADLITSVPNTNPRLDVAVDTAAAFLSSQLASAAASSETKLRLVDFVARVMAHIGSPKADPELAHACVDFVSRLIPIHGSTLAQVPTEFVNLLLNFTIQCLAGSDLLPKKAAMNLWSAIVGMSSQPGELFQQLMTSFGPSLTTCLVFNFGGNAARSEIEGLSRVYRKLVTKYPQTKAWTESALFSPEFPGERASDADKRRFVSQLMLCRDVSTTDRVCREFWTLCRGTPAGYG